MRKSIFEEVMIIDRKVQALWREIADVGKHHPEIKEDTDLLEMQGAMIYLKDMTNRLAEKHKTEGKRS